MRLCIDPGHGMGNRERGKFDTGAVVAGVREADIALAWARCLRARLKDMGHTVILTRVDNVDPAPVSRRDDIALAYRCDRMISLHCNWASSFASGSEVFYRGADDRALAAAISSLVARHLDIPDRGAKLESQSQHKSLAVLEFDKCWLVEIGFLTHGTDRARMLDLARMHRACDALAHLITTA